MSAPIPPIPADVTRAVPTPVRPPPNEVRQLVQQIQAAQAAGYSREQISEALQRDKGISLADFERQTRVSAANLARAAGTGATFGFLDEMLGALRTPGGAGRGIISALDPQSTGRPDYEAARAQVAGPQETFRAAHPFVSGAAEAGGGLLLPIGVAGTAARAPVSFAQGLLRGAGRGAVAGAAGGAVAGAGYAEEPGDIPLRTGLGAVLGGVGGGVLGGLLGGATAGIQRPVVGAQRIQQAVEEAGGPGVLRRQAGEFARAGRGDVPVAALAPELAQEAEFAVTAAPGVRTRQVPALQSRQAGQSERMLGDVRELLAERTAVPASRQRIVRAISARGVEGDALANAGDLADELLEQGARIDADGMVTLYHRTSPEQAQRIVRSGTMTGKEDGVFFSTSPRGQAEGFGDAVIRVRTPLEKLQLDDVFGNEAHVRIPLPRGGARISVQAEPFTATTLGAGPNVNVRIEQLKEARRAFADPAYEAIGGLVVDDPRIGQFLSRPHVHRVYERAVEEGQIAGQIERRPTFRQLNSLRQTLNDETNAAFMGGRGSRGAALREAANELDNLLEEAVPAFRVIQNRYRQLSEPIRAAEAGVEWFKQADRRELTRFLGTLGPDEAREFRDALASELITDLQRRATNIDQAQRLLNASPDMQAKLRIIFGKSGQRELLGRLNLERAERELYKGTLGSPTARREALRGVDPLELATASQSPLGAAGMLSRLLKPSQATVNARIAKQMEPFLFRPSRELDELLRTLARQAVRGRPPAILGTGAPAATGLLLGRQ